MFWYYDQLCLTNRIMELGWNCSTVLLPTYISLYGGPTLKEMLSRWYTAAVQCHNIFPITLCQVSDALLSPFEKWQWVLPMGREETWEECPQLHSPLSLCCTLWLSITSPLKPNMRPAKEVGMALQPCKTILIQLFIKITNIYAN